MTTTTTTTTTTTESTAASAAARVNPATAAPEKRDNDDGTAPMPTSRLIARAKFAFKGASASELSFAENALITDVHVLEGEVLGRLC
jgi:hypothetical protein